MLQLVEVRIDPDADGEDPAQVRARYGYNGLHWRVWRIADEDFDASALPDAANLYYYDAMWRLLEERVRGDFGSSEDEWSEVLPDSGDLLKLTQRFWCLHYIDDLIAWQTQDEEPDGAFQDGDALFYALTDRLYSVIGVMDGVGADYTLIERVRYTAYGSARHIPFSLGDANGDGYVTFADFSVVLAHYGEEYEDEMGAYTPDGDFGLDGEIDFDDYTLVLGFAGQGLPEGALSLPEVGNTIGYTGHHFDPATGMTLARFRWLEHDLGRWINRDPAGYVDGMNLYEFVRGNPHKHNDWDGQKICTPASGSLRLIMEKYAKEFSPFTRSGNPDPSQRISWKVLSCIACIESSYNPCAQGKTDDYGLMQLTKTGAVHPGRDLQPGRRIRIHRRASQSVLWLRQTTTVYEYRPGRHGPIKGLCEGLRRLDLERGESDQVRRTLSQVAPR